MKKFFLSTTLPENAQIPLKSAPDLAHSLNAYQLEKSQYRNEPPTVRPQPLEKYEIKGQSDQQLILQEERDADVLNEVEEDEEEQITPNEFEGLIAALPDGGRKKARKLLPYLMNIDFGDLDLQNLLYDLTIRNVKTIKSDYTKLASVYRQLDGDITLPRSYYIKKQLPITSRELDQLMVTKRTPKMATLSTPMKNAPTAAPTPVRYPSRQAYYQQSRLGKGAPMASYIPKLQDALDEEEEKLSPPRRRANLNTSIVDVDWE